MKINKKEKIFLKDNCQTNNFISFTLSNFYLYMTKDILYIEKADSKVRRSVQTVIYNIINNLVTLFIPILPYT